MAKAMSRRFETRLDDETDDLIGKAAELTRQSKSAFVTAAARAEAERVVARASVTLISPGVFDALAGADVPSAGSAGTTEARLGAPEGVDVAGVASDAGVTVDRAPPPCRVPDVPPSEPHPVTDSERARIVNTERRWSMAVSGIFSWVFAAADLHRPVRPATS